MTLEKYLSHYNFLYRKLIQIALDKIRLTRKSKKISDKIIVRELKYWSKFEAKKVIASLYIYLNKEYYKENKREKYIRGIIRNITQRQIEQISLFNNNYIEKLISKLRKRVIGNCEKCNGRSFIIKQIKGNTAFVECECVKKFNYLRSEIKNANQLKI